MQVHPTNLLNSDVGGLIDKVSGNYLEIKNH